MIGVSSPPDEAGRVVGYVLFSPVSIESAGRPCRAIGLGPMAVHPDHPRVAYTLLRSALSYYEQSRKEGRDQTFTRQAVERLDDVQKRFPNSSEAAEAETLWLELRKRLGSHVLLIGDFYLELPSRKESPHRSPISADPDRQRGLHHGPADRQPTDRRRRTAGHQKRVPLLDRRIVELRQVQITFHVSRSDRARRGLGLQWEVGISHLRGLARWPPALPRGR